MGEKPRTIRRWAFGYSRRGKDYEPAIFPDHPESIEAQALTFLDLVELLFIKGCLQAGVSWPKVREAASTAARLLGAGAPIVQGGGVRTDILAGMYQAGDSVATIASWFEVEEHEVLAAIRYEEGRAA
ncbi:MAG: DUF433 domain-containing protein [Longimicrobiales bacterium]